MKKEYAEYIAEIMCLGGCILLNRVVELKDHGDVTYLMQNFLI